MSNPDYFSEIDLKHAYETMDRLGLEGGDLGGIYWHKVANLLREANLYRQQARTAEEKLKAIQSILSGVEKTWVFDAEDSR